MPDDRQELISGKFGLFFAHVDAGGVVNPENDSLLRYLSYDTAASGYPLSELFPETVGLEEMIREVASGEKDEFVLTDINRDAGKELYYNLIMMPSRERPGELLLVVEDITTECRIRQSLQQSRNEIIILHNQLIVKNHDLDRANAELLKSQSELRELNQQLEMKVHERTGQLEKSTMLSKRLFEQTVNALMLALEKRDSYTAGHQQRVSILAAAIARELDLDEDTVEGIRIAGKLHDIGKIYVPNEFLTKPDRISEEEYNVIRTHPRVGFDILQHIEFPWPVASITLQHHERINGTGYPYGLEGDEILFEAKILAVADVVEAMATNRPFRLSPGIEKALDEISSNVNTYYDPQVVEACLRLFRQKGFFLPAVEYKI